MSRVAVACAAVVAIAGCAPDVPGESETQTIADFGSGMDIQVHWPEGRPDDGLSPGDAEVVEALRDWDLRVSAARLTHDYSDARMLDLSSNAIYSSYISGFLFEDVRQVRRGTTFWTQEYPMGPTPFTVRSVRHEGGQVLVEVCRASSWWHREDPDGEDWREASGGIVTWVLEASPEGYVVDERQATLEFCSIEGARFGFFQSPVPAYGESFEFDDVILPNGDPVTAEMAASMP